MKHCIICGNSHKNKLAKTCSTKCEVLHRKNLEKKRKEEEKTKIRKEKAKTKKSFSRSTLIKEADRCWSLAIRERDRGKPCITCGTPWTESAQAGHFQSRRHLNTRWLLVNGASQCPKCNCWGAGEQYEFALALENKSPGLPEQIRRLALSTDKITDEEIIGYIKILYHELSEMCIDFHPKKIYLEYTSN